MLAQVEFISGLKEGSKLTENQSGAFIHKNCLLNKSLYLVDLNGVINIQQVETGELKDGEWLEIKNGLKAGQKAIYAPASSLKAGQKIKIGKLYE